jgi:hypothetical protein
MPFMQEAVMLEDYGEHSREGFNQNKLQDALFDTAEKDSKNNISYRSRILLIRL